MNNILVGMSGGVDSSAAALILLNQGVNIEGATLIVHDGGEADAADAKKVCDVLNIKHRIIDARQAFKDYVISNFISEYRAGRTPNPCIICNKFIKFGFMLDYAKNAGFDGIATGHYAETATDNSGTVYLKKSTSPKDQSYFLYMLNQQQLKHTVFPVVGKSKDEIRAIAQAAGLPTAHKKDSQEICFVPDNDYAAFLKRSGVQFCEGNFTDSLGNVIGKHSGIVNYTVGQRKGLGVGFGKPMYVTGINAAAGTVSLGDNADLFKYTLTADNLCFADGNYKDRTFKAEAKIRYRAAPAEATVKIKNKTATLTFVQPQRAITPGQSVVFYNGDILLGGGIIK